jgi:uncharacterized protein (DUF1778 family)
MQLNELGERVTRKCSPPIKVYCLPDERKLIAATASAARLSLSNYLLKVGMGYQVRSVIDGQHIVDLAKINADQGRLGGLLKLLLSNDMRFRGLDEASMRSAIRAVLSRIEETQAALVVMANKACEKF